MLRVCICNDAVKITNSKKMRLPSRARRWSCSTSYSKEASLNYKDQEDTYCTKLTCAAMDLLPRSATPLPLSIKPFCVHLFPFQSVGFTCATMVLLPRSAAASEERSVSICDTASRRLASVTCAVYWVGCMIHQSLKLRERRQGWGWALTSSVDIAGWPARPALCIRLLWCWRRGLGLRNGDVQVVGRGKKCLQ